MTNLWTLEGWPPLALAISSAFIGLTFRHEKDRYDKPMNNPAVALKRKLAHLPEARKKQLRRLGQIAMTLLPHKHNLATLCVKYGGDKLEHGYIEHYQRIFSPIRKKKLRILEIGIGGFEDPNAGGESLRMWRDFFPNSMIYGIDIYDKRGIDNGRIKTFKGDQSSAVFLNGLVAEIGRPDIVIDDGSHQNNHVIASFNILFPQLADNGIYVIEDLYSSYWKLMGGGWDNGAEKNTSISMLKNLVDSLNYRYIPNRIPSELDLSVVSLLLYRKLAFIQKGCNEMEDPVFIINDLRTEERNLTNGNIVTPAS